MAKLIENVLPSSQKGLNRVLFNQAHVAGIEGILIRRRLQAIKSLYACGLPE